jgi:lipoprotein-anchoring transpeptidase ErfK/SrfK
MAATSRTTPALAAVLTICAVGAANAAAQEGAAPADGAAAAGGRGAANGPAGGDLKGPKGPVVRDARIRLRIGGLKRGKLTVGNRFKAKGTLAPYVEGEKVTVVVKRGGKTIKRKVIKPKHKRGSNFSRFRISGKQIKPGRYSVRAIHKRSEALRYEKAKSGSFKIRYPSLRAGNRSSKVKLLNRLLARKGYVNDRGKRYDAATERAVLAFRKVNKMARKTKATSKIFKRLAKGKGGYKVTHPGSGKHVEADLSRQIMVLVNGRKVKEIYHVSTGAAATPTYPGTWRFYRKDPGFNSLGMYYSVYYNRGYAIHGYKSVPTYPASHGCLRNPIPNSKHIYDWVQVGMPIHISR